VADRPYAVLFLCTGNSARSIMAEAILNRLGAGKFRAYSAGSQPKGQVHPETLRLMRSLGYDTSGFRSKSWDEFAAAPGAPEFDFVFTVCDNAAAEACPLWPGQPMTAHWGIPDPAAASGTPAEIALAFKDAYRMLHQRIGIFTALPLRARSVDAATQAEGDRPHARRGGEGGGADVKSSLTRRVVAESLGTAFLLAAVVGSGIMAARLAGGNGALALLGNTLPTGAMLTVLILTLGPISGAHFNPAVSIAATLRGEMPASVTALYVGAQVLGGILGVWAAHLMFELPLWQVSVTTRTGQGQWLAEAVATFGLLLTIFGCGARTPAAVPYAVGLYITAAYWFTASTSFANPAVTIARSLSDTFAGIAPAGVAAFIGAQLLGMLAAVVLGRWLWPSPRAKEAE
jgi:glycerol uptake facilitator-like aquaporin/protein-tyrosine-phosphatase